MPVATVANSLPRTPEVLAWARDKHDGKYWQRPLGDMDFEAEKRLVIEVGVFSTSA